MNENNNIPALPENKMAELTKRFNKLWEDFTALYKGELLGLAAGEEGLTATGAVNALSEIKRNWGASDTIYGRWVIMLKAQDPEKGDRVLRILTEDMNVEPVAFTPEGENSKVGAGVTGGATGAAAGYFLPKLLGASTLLSAATAVAGGAAGIIGAIHLVNSRKTPALDRALKEYLDHLNQFHDRVYQVLEK